MVVLNILNIAASAFYMYLFTIIHKMKIKSRSHTVLALMALALFQWNTFAYFVYNTNNVQVLEILLPVSCIGMFLVFPLNFHFAYTLSSKKPLPNLYALAVYLPAVVLIIINFLSPFSLVIAALPDGTFNLAVPKEHPMNLIWIFYAVLMWFIPLGYYIRYHRQAKLNREKKQAVLLIRMLLAAIILVTGEYILNPIIPGWDVPTQSPVIFSVWIGALVYAIWKYGFLKISPGLLAEKILDSVEDLVLLYDLDGKRVYQNRKAQSFLGDSRLVPFFRTDPLKANLNPLLALVSVWTPKDPEKEFIMTVPDDSAGSGEEREIKFRVKPLFDRFGDPLGLLVSGSAIPRLDDVLLQYQLSAREIEVFNHLSRGKTIQETAETLYITERTVKAHISSIYEKTGAKNRVELLNMIKSSEEK
ncbi:MAG: LuxR C-terminal-related transcriptional regulator [Spirochaetia bacterium]